MAIDVITGQYFVPKFEGQRTLVDVAAEGATTEEYLASVQASLEDQLNIRYANDPYYQATRESMQAEWDNIYLEEVRAGNTDAERHVVTAAEEAEALGRIGRAAEKVGSQLIGGYNPNLDYGEAGPNIFLRTEQGLGSWVGKDRFGQDMGGRVPLNPNYREGQGQTFTGPVPTGPVTQVPPTNNQFGNWIGTEDMIHTSDFVDTDGDGIDDRWQAGPGEPDSRISVTDTTETEAEIPTLGLADFIASLQGIGIDKDFATSLWEWGKTKLIDPDYSASMFALDVYDTDAFQQRFPAITQQRELENVTPFTPREYLEYEQVLLEDLSAHAIGGQNIDFDGLVTNLIVNNVGTAEVGQRLAAAQRVLGDVPIEIKDTYMDWYGPDVAPENLMKTFLDPDDKWGGSWADVDRAAGVAEVGGWVKQRLRFEETENVSQGTAAAINRLGLSAKSVWENLDALRTQEALFAENIDEGIDLSITDEGLSSQFGLDDESEDLLSGRRETRAARFMGGGGAMLTGTTTGFGAANA